MPPDKKTSILLIEDDAFLAQIYAKAFESQNFDVSLAAKGEDGLKLAERAKPDLIFLDLMLPDVEDDLFSILKKFKAEQAFANVPIVVLSNLGQREDVERALALGAAAYFIKAHTLPNDAIRKIKEILHLA